MSSSKYSLSEEQFDPEALRRYYIYAKTLFTTEPTPDLDLIFDVAIDNPDRFPSIYLKDEKTPENYIGRWIKSYIDAYNNPPQKRNAKPKSACTDPAIAVIVSATQDMTADQTTSGEYIHNLFMSAENIQGSLLEEYIASKVRPYGFLWCDGNVLRAIDFCNTDGSLLLQIKNKYNTENSSSSNIREGTRIEKWYRLGSKKRNKMTVPVFRWEILNELISEHRTQGFDLPPCNMSEEEYEQFLKKVAKDNSGIISDK